MLWRLKGELEMSWWCFVDIADILGSCLGSTGRHVSSIKCLIVWPHRQYMGFWKKSQSMMYDCKCDCYHIIVVGIPIIQSTKNQHDDWLLNPPTETRLFDEQYYSLQPIINSNTFLLDHQGILYTKYSRHKVGKDKRCNRRNCIFYHRGLEPADKVETTMAGELAKCNTYSTVDNN